MRDLSFFFFLNNNRLINNTDYENIKIYIWIACFAIALWQDFTSCSENDSDAYPGGNGPVTVSAVHHLEDAESTVPDREVAFARLGQTLRLEGSGWWNKKILVNGWDAFQHGSCHRQFYDITTSEQNSCKRCSPTQFVIKSSLSGQWYLFIFIHYPFAHLRR